MTTDSYTSTAYRPDRIPLQPPPAERSWYRRAARVQLPWGNTQELAPAMLFYKASPDKLRLLERVAREDEERKTNGSYEPRITETEDFHYIHDHQRYRFAQLSIGGRFWTNLYLFGKGGFFIMILPTLIGIFSVFPIGKTLSNEEVGDLINILSIALGTPLTMWAVGSLVIHKLPRLWARPSRGPLWEFNRQTGMVTLFDYSEYKKNGTIGELTAPFHEFDAYVISSPDRQGLPMNVLELSHRYRDIRFNLSPILHQSDDANEHFALWDYLQNYMDVSRPLPDIPYLEQFRHLDPTTAEHDRRTGRNPRYWIDMDDDTFKAKINEVLADIRDIDTLGRPNLMARYVEYE